MLLLIKRSVNYTPLTPQTLNSLAREPSSLKDRSRKPNAKMESLYAATGINKTNNKQTRKPKFVFGCCFWTLLTLQVLFSQLGVFPAWPRPVTCLSPGRGWFTRNHGPWVSAVFWFGFVEWKRSHSERKTVWFDWTWRLEYLTIQFNNIFWPRHWFHFWIFCLDNFFNSERLGGHRYDQKEAT